MCLCLHLAAEDNAQRIAGEARRQAEYEAEVQQDRQEVMDTCQLGDLAKYGNSTYTHHGRIYTVWEFGRVTSLHPVHVQRDTANVPLAVKLPSAADRAMFERLRGIGAACEVGGYVFLRTKPRGFKWQSCMGRNSEAGRGRKQRQSWVATAYGGEPR